MNTYIQNKMHRQTSEHILSTSSKCNNFITIGTVHESVHGTVAIN